jgi:hypothetical protein
MPSVTIAELQRAIRKDRGALRDCERRGDARNAAALREEIARFQAAIAKRRKPKARANPLVSDRLKRRAAGEDPETVAIHERAASVLGWTPREVRSHSMPSLREAVRGRDPQLVRAMDLWIRGGGWAPSPRKGSQGIPGPVPAWMIEDAKKYTNPALPTFLIVFYRNRGGLGGILREELWMESKESARRHAEHVVDVGRAGSWRIRRPARRREMPRAGGYPIGRKA